MRHGTNECCGGSKSNCPRTRGAARATVAPLGRCEFAIRRADEARTPWTRSAPGCQRSGAKTSVRRLSTITVGCGPAATLGAVRCRSRPRRQQTGSASHASSDTALCERRRARLGHGGGGGTGRGAHAATTWSPPASAMSASRTGTPRRHRCVRRRRRCRGGLFCWRRQCAGGPERRQGTIGAGAIVWRLAEREVHNVSRRCHHVGAPDADPTTLQSVTAMDTTPTATRSRELCAFAGAALGVAIFSRNGSEANYVH